MFQTKLQASKTFKQVQDRILGVWIILLKELKQNQLHYQHLPPMQNKNVGKS